MFSFSKEFSDIESVIKVVILTKRVLFLFQRQELICHILAFTIHQGELALVAFYQICLFALDVCLMNFDLGLSLGYQMIFHFVFAAEHYETLL